MHRFKPGDRVVITNPFRKHHLKQQFYMDIVVIKDYYDYPESAYEVKNTKEYLEDSPDEFFFLDSELSPLETPEVFTDEEYKEFFV